MSNNKRNNKSLNLIDNLADLVKEEGLDEEDVYDAIQEEYPNMSEADIGNLVFKVMKKVRNN